MSSRLFGVRLSGPSLLPEERRPLGRFPPRAVILFRRNIVSVDQTRELTGWQIFTLPLRERDLKRLKYSSGRTQMPAFYRAQFKLNESGDTFLDFSTWGKGLAWVNGHNLGRFWNIGPHQTLYCPGPWLKNGRNELVVFELNGAAHPFFWGAFVSFGSPG